jgi:hypothetical protein
MPWNNVNSIRDIPVGSLPIIQETNIDDYHRTMMFQMASSRARILAHSTTLELILYSAEFRFLELKMLLYQWRHQYVVVSYHEPETKTYLLLAQRVLRQFREYLTKFAAYYPIVPEQNRPLNEPGDDSVDKVLENCKNPGKQDLNSVAVALVVDLLIVIEVYEQKIERYSFEDSKEHKDKCTYGLSDIMTWYEKLTFFMKAIVNTLKPWNRLLIAVYKCDIPNRNDKAFDNIAILPTVHYEEMDYPKPEPVPEAQEPLSHQTILETKLEKLLQGYRFPPSNGINDEEITRYFEQKWHDSMTDPETTVLQLAEDNVVQFKRTKRQRRRERAKAKAEERKRYE